MDYYSSESAGMAGGIGAVFFIVYIAVIIIAIAGMWKTFTKAGQPGWAAIIPIYNIYVMIKIVGKPSIWLLWCLLPCVNIIFSIWLTNLISKSYGKEEGFTIGLLLLPFIFWPILGFGNARYVGPSAKEAQNSVFGNQFGHPNDPFNQPPSNPS